MTEKNTEKTNQWGFFYMWYAGNYVNRKIQKLIDKKHRYWKDNFLTIIQDTWKKSSDWTPLFTVWFYKQEYWFPVNWKDQIKTILDYLKEKENNITVNGNTCKELGDI